MPETIAALQDANEACGERVVELERDLAAAIAARDAARRDADTSRAIIDRLRLANALLRRPRLADVYVVRAGQSGVVITAANSVAAAARTAARWGHAQVTKCRLELTPDASGEIRDADAARIDAGLPALLAALDRELARIDEQKGGRP